MPQKKSSKPNNSTRTTKTPTPKRLKTWQVVTLVLFIAILGLILYKAYDTYQINKQAKADKILLDRVDQKMRIVYDKIVADLGEPAYKSFEKTCTYPNVKGDRGKPTCGPIYFMLYDTRGSRSDEGIIERIKTSVKDSNITTVTDESISRSPDSEDYWVYYDADLRPIEGVKCWVMIQRDKTNSFYGEDYTKYINTPKSWGISIGCKKLERKPVYRVDS